MTREQVPQQTWDVPPAGRDRPGGGRPGRPQEQLVACGPGPGHAGGPVDMPALGMAVMSPWGWRILAVVTMVAAGLCITFFLDGHTVFGAVWVVITAAWGFFTNKLRACTWTGPGPSRFALMASCRRPSPRVRRRGRHVSEPYRSRS